jgi:hypothetical protein
MGQHPRTWFSSTTAGFPRADAAWLLRQISSLETPVKKIVEDIDLSRIVGRMEGLSVDPATATS